jgi:hypothetical protein
MQGAKEREKESTEKVLVSLRAHINIPKSATNLHDFPKICCMQNSFQIL